MPEGDSLKGVGSPSFENMIVITDILKEPFDEGGKIATLSLLRALREKHSVIVFSLNSQYEDRCIDERIRINKGFLGVGFLKMVKRSRGRILYVPEASATFFSFLRAWLLSLFTGKMVVMLSFQKRGYSCIERFVIARLCSRIHVLSQSVGSVSYLKEVGVSASRLSLGVDDIKYRELDEELRRRLRRKYSIKDSAKVVLHVGHVAPSRNLKWLIEIRRAFPEIVVMMVGSTSTSTDEKIFRGLRDCGVYLISGYLPNIEEIYNIADIYLFPVLSTRGAIETPLSVLEAMACNIRVITTRFGSLPELFKEDESFRFVESFEQVVEYLKGPLTGLCTNREKVRLFSWSSIADDLVKRVRDRA